MFNLLKRLFKKKETEPYYCSECGTKMALYSTYVDVWEANQEPYQAGVEEKIGEDEQLLYDTFLSLAAVICPSCRRMRWLSIEEASNVVEEIINHAKEG